MPLRHPVARQMVGVASDDVDEATNEQRMREVIEPYTETTMREAQADLQRLLDEVENDMQVAPQEWQDLAAQAVQNTVNPLAQLAMQNTNCAPPANMPVMQQNTITLSAGQTFNATVITEGTGNVFTCGRGGLSPESDYCLDGWVSCNDITCDVASYVRLFGFNLDAFLDDQERRSRHVGDTVTESLMRTGRELREQYLNWRAGATPERRAVCGLSMLFGIGHQFSDYHWEVSDKAVISLLRDGTDSMEDRVLDPAFLAQTIQTTPRLANWCSDISEGLEMLRADYTEARKGGIRHEIDRLYNQPRLFVGTAGAGEPVTVYDTSSTTTQNLNCYIGTTIAGGVIQNVNYMRRPAQRRVPRRTLKLVRQAVKRSADLFVRQIGREQLSQFLKGQPFLIPGEHFHYEISKTSSVLQHTASPLGGHIPYNLMVVDRDDETRLCKLCVYFDKTPVLDQIVALAMFIRSGNEEEMLRRANAFDRHEKFKTHPKMIEFGKARPTAIDEVLNALNTVTVTNNTIQGTLTTNNVQLGDVRPGDTVEGGYNFGLISEVHHVEVFGVTSREHREEVVPWRVRTHDPVIQAVSQMTNLPVERFRRIVAERDRSLTDTVMTWRHMPDTFDELLERAFA